MTTVMWIPSADIETKERDQKSNGVYLIFLRLFNTTVLNVFL